MTFDHPVDQRPLTPLLGLDLSDGDRAVGWIRGRTIGFRGFTTELDAAVAAWVADAAIARRLGRRAGAGPVLADVPPLALERRDGGEVILARERRIGTLVRPEAGPESDRDSFGFEVEIPGPAHELRMRAMAHLIYQTLRRSGVRRARRASDGTSEQPSIATAQEHSADSLSTRGGTTMYNPMSDRRIGSSASIPVRMSPRRDAALGATTFVSRFLLISLAIVASIILLIAAPLTVTLPLGFVFFAYLLGSVVLMARDRRRRGARGRGSMTVTGSRRTTARESGAEAGDGVPTSAGTLAVVGIGLLGAAFVAPEQIGVALAAIALGGLFVLRMFAMSAGWAPHIPSRRHRIRPAERSPRVI